MRKQILAAFDQGTIKTRAAYIALEHEWMHLETLAYMLAQEQRRAFESSAPAVNGRMSHGKTKMNGSAEADSSSEDDAPQHAQREPGPAMSHTNGGANGVSKGVSNGHANGVTDNGLASASNGNGVTSDHYSSLTNGNNGHMHLNQDHVTVPVSTLVIPAGDVTLGVDTDPTRNFVWDNEGPSQDPQHVSSFRMAARPVSNSEFHRFAVECGGYDEEEYWTAADLECLKKRKQQCPATWTLQVAEEAFTVSQIESGFSPTCHEFCHGIAVLVLNICL